MVPTGPEDVLNEIEKWKKRQSLSKHASIGANVRNGMAQM